MRAQMQQECQ
jgi:hypothetical protein